MSNKRSHYVLITPESEAMAKMRTFRNVSTRELAPKLGMSHTALHLLEVGRADIHPEFISKFLEVLKFSQIDWDYFKASPDKLDSAKDECSHILNSLEPSKIMDVLLYLRTVSGKSRTIF